MAELLPTVGLACDNDFHHSQLLRDIFQEIGLNTHTHTLSLMMMVVILALFLSLLAPVTADPVAYSCYGGNYTAKSSFQSNLNLLLASLSSPNSTFLTDAVGSVPDRAYGLVLCRGDAVPADCAACLNNAAEDVVSVCPISKQATVWYDNCELRYSDLSFYSIVYEEHYQILTVGANATDIDSFVELEAKLLDEVTRYAAINSSMKFATGVAPYANGSQRMYALAQCTRDLSPAGCSRCLHQIRGYYQGYEMKVAGRVLGQSCSVRYELDQFFVGKPMLSLDHLSASASPPPSSSPVPQSASDNGKGSKNNTSLSKAVLIVTIVIDVVTVLLVVGICFWKRSPTAIPTGMATLEDVPSSEWLLFNLPMLKVATNNFADSKKLGQGGFGTVYRGTLANGEDIAVKRLSASSRQGLKELKNELMSVARLQHRNLVRLRGVCLDEDEKLLIYDYVPNGSLDDFLFDPVKCKQLTWEIRFKIIRGIAQGLLYLHEETHLKVIHRDLKASNVLLDSDMSPKISDFGLARLFAEDETRHITSQVVGTFGYMAPEYARHGHFSTKLDVYSFGILVLEIVTGKRSNGFQYDSEISRDILSYAWEHLRNGTPLEIIDPSMGENFSSDEVLKCIQIALLCAEEVPAYRPLMSSVFIMLHCPSTCFQELLQPKLVHVVCADD